MCCSWRGKLTIRSREVESLILLCVGGKSSLIIAWVWQGKILMLAESLFSSCSAKTALDTLFIGGSWIYPVMELKMSSFIYSPWLVSCFVPAILMQSLVGVIIGQIILLYPHSVGLNFVFELLNANRILIRLTFSPPRIPNFNRYEVEGSIGSVQNRLLSNAAPSLFYLKGTNESLFHSGARTQRLSIVSEACSDATRVLIPSKWKQMTMSAEFYFGR